MEYLNLRDAKDLVEAMISVLESEQSDRGTLYGTTLLQALSYNKIYAIKIVRTASKELVRRQCELQLQEMRAHNPIIEEYLQLQRKLDELSS